MTMNLKRWVMTLILLMTVNIGFALDISWNNTSDWSPQNAGDDLSLTQSGYVVTAMTSGALNPPVVSDYKDLRIYARGELSLRAINGTPLQKVVFRLSQRGKARLADITPSTGKVTIDSVAGIVSWEGSASQVTLTVGAKAVHGTEGASKAGQFCIDSPIQIGDSSGEKDPDSFISMAQAQKQSAGNLCKVKGSVVATGLSGFLMGDDTGFIYYYNPEAATSYEVGDILEIEGKLTSYGGFNQFTSTATIRKTGHSYHDYGVARKLDGAGVEQWLASPKIEYVRLEGTLEISGGYFDVNVEGTEKKINIGYSEAKFINALSDGDNVEMEGYAFMSTGGNRFLCCIISRMSVNESLPDENQLAPEVPVGSICLNFTVPSFGGDSSISSIEHNGVRIEFTPAAKVSKSGSGQRTISLAKGTFLTISSTSAVKIKGLQFNMSEGRMADADNKVVSRYSPDWTGDSENVSFTVTEASEIFYIIVSFASEDVDISTDGYAMTISLDGSVELSEYVKNKYSFGVFKEDGSLLRTFLLSSKDSFKMLNLKKGSALGLGIVNSEGRLVGKLKEVTVPANSFSVVLTKDDFPSFCRKSIRLLDPEGKDRTTEGSFVWHSADGSIVGVEAVLADAISGESYSVDVRINETLSREFINPGSIVVGVDDIDTSVNLSRHPKTALSLKITDKKESLPLVGVRVSYSQVVNGVNVSGVNVSDKDGVCRIEVNDEPVQLNLNAQGYLPLARLITKEELRQDSVVGEAGINIGMQTISGAEITVKASRKDCDGVERQDVIKPENLRFKVINITSGKPMEHISYQYPVLTVVDTCAVGDQMRIEASMAGSSMSPVTASVSLDSELKANLNVTFTQNGGIDVAVAGGNKSQVVLFDSDGKQLSRKTAAVGEVRFAELQDGLYTVAGIDNYEDYAGYPTLESLEQSELKENEHYKLNREISVTAGNIAIVDLGKLPEVDPRDFSLLSEATQFSANTSSVTVGNYITYSAFVGFKDPKASYDGLQMKFRLDDGLQFVDNSVMIGKTVSAYQLSADGKELTVSVSSPDKVRFCAVPVMSGQIGVIASAEFTAGGSRHKETLGECAVQSEALTLDVPSTTPEAEITASGHALPDSKVTIFDGEDVIASTTSSATGEWTAKCALVDPYNLSRHSIHASVVSPDGQELETEVKQVNVDFGQVYATKVTMVNIDHSSHKPTEQKTVFNLLDPADSGNSYYRFWPRNPEFSFMIDLNTKNPDDVEAITLKVFTSKERWRLLRPVYNAQLGQWTCTDSFDTSELPVGVKVEVLAADVNVLSDRDQLTRMDNDIADIIKEYNDLKSSVSDDDDLGPDLSDDPEVLAAIAALTEEQRKEMESDEYMEEYLKKWDEEIALFEKSMSEDMESTGCDVIKVHPYEVHTEEEWLSMGFTKIGTTDGSNIYMRREDKSVFMVDCLKEEYLEIVAPDSDSEVVKQAAKLLSFKFDAQHALEVFKDTAWSLFEGIEGEFEKVEKTFDAAITAVRGQLGRHNTAVGFQERTLMNEKRGLDNLLKQFNEAKTQAEKDALQKSIDAKRASIAKKESNLKWAKRNKKLTEGNIKALRGLQKWFKRTLKIIQYKEMIFTMIENISSIKNVALLLPDECKCDPNSLASLGRECDNYMNNEIAFMTGRLAGEAINDLASIGLIVGSAGAAVPAVTLKNGVKKIIVDITIDWLHDKIIESWCNSASDRIMALSSRCNTCDPDNPEDEEFHLCNCTGPENCSCLKLFCLCNRCNRWPFPLKKPIQDPSGFVYEGSEDNRLEGVTATLYKKETVTNMYGEQEEKVVMWDAAAYGQVNPQTTDVDGYYRWDVPVGMWQVKFEKDGYKTVSTEWLPVPPPQLDINIGMTYLGAPAVATASAASDAVNVTFDRMIDASTLVTDNVFVESDGAIVKGSIALTPNETGLAKMFTFVPETPIASDYVTVGILKRVKSYSGVEMDNDYRQEIPVSLKLSKIELPETVDAEIGVTLEVPVKAYPAKAAAGRVLKVTSPAWSKINILNEEVTLNDNGEGVISILPLTQGTASVDVADEKLGVSTSMVVLISDASPAAVATPRASMPTGSVLDEGASIYLSCSTPNSEIVYTLDGSCPCDNTAALQVYDGNPIVITKSLILKAMARAEGMSDSEVAEYRYYLSNSTGVTTVGDDNSDIHIAVKEDAIEIHADGQMIKGVWLTSLTGQRHLLASGCRDFAEINHSEFGSGVWIIQVVTDKAQKSRKIIVRP